ncbi:MAG TPA: GNAT family N-acetyltransferase [Candidatus Alistipes pullicola]|nr:GNAT family N-acetyltransferase [Candidatus Alistipes pullicola]
MAHIRFATESDIPLIYGFILKMARYEKLENEVDTSEEALHRAIFLEKQAEVILCEAEGKTVGFALFFHNFSTFKGQHGLYLEDIYVDQEYRGRGYGKAMFLRLVAIAMERRCRRMEWTALNWNRPAIAFYESMGAVRMSEWSTFRLDEEHLRILNAAQQTH